MATKRPALGRILDVWRAETKVNQPLASYRELLKVRHWAAHGQRWTLKSSFRGGPWDAWGVVEDLVVALRAHVADFPLDG